MGPGRPRKSFTSISSTPEPELIILDDLCRDEPLTEEQIKRLKTWFVDAAVKHAIGWDDPRKMSSEELHDWAYGHRTFPFGFVRPHL